MSSFTTVNLECRNWHCISLFSLVIIVSWSSAGVLSQIVEVDMVWDSASIKRCKTHPTFSKVKIHRARPWVSDTYNLSRDGRT